MNRLGRALSVLRHEGWRVFAKRSLRWLGRVTRLRPPPRVTGTYSYVSSNPYFLITEDMLAASRMSAARRVTRFDSALWFIPHFSHITYGGIYTVFRFVEAFSVRGLSTTVVIYSDRYKDCESIGRDIASHFPTLSGLEIVGFDPNVQSVDMLPERSIAFATLWTSAYLLLAYNQAARKYYFIQDYEPAFFAAGPHYALAESTYRFGFGGIVNTPGLFRALEERYGLEGVSFVPAVDARYYYADPSQTLNCDNKRVFFYARPNASRNAFELGVLTIKDLLRRHGDSIEVVTAGSGWDERDYGLEGRIRNLGLLMTPQEVGDLYRSCDIGFVFMLSKHPSYQPFEFMACGMATVSNRNEDNLWFLEDGKNCLLAEPSPSAMAEKITQLIEDEDLRRAIATAGQRAVESDWEPQIDRVWRYIVEDRDR